MAKPFQNTGRQNKKPRERFPGLASLEILGECSPVQPVAAAAAIATAATNNQSLATVRRTVWHGNDFVANLIVNHQLRGTKIRFLKCTAIFSSGKRKMRKSANFR
jgi:hypothetical protein